MSDQNQVSTKACPACGEQIMATATICRFCKTSLKDSSSGLAGRFLTVFGVGVATVAGIIAVLYVVSTLAEGSSDDDYYTGYGGAASVGAHVPQPSFTVQSVDANDDCTSLTNYCVRVSCTVANTGDGDGLASVELQLVSDGKYPITDQQSIQVPAGDVRVISHEFQEAEIGDDAPQGRCVIQ